MNKYFFGLLLLLFPQFVKAQNRSNSKPNRSLITSLEIGGSTYNTKVFEFAALIGIKDNDEASTLEMGYVYKHILDKGIGHSPLYHGLRGAMEIKLLGGFGTYGTYDVIIGKRWLYNNVFDDGMKVHVKIHGEGTVGIFLTPKRSFLKFYVGIEPQHYDPANIRVGLTPHKSSSINLKVKYKIDL
jgi:hypothetical protein